MSVKAPRETLDSFEKRALALVETANETTAGKWLQGQWIRHALYPVVRTIIARRTYAAGTQWLSGFKPDRGVLLAANHRSFFDQWLLILSLFRQDLRFFDRIYFPVRSNYFYEKRSGVLVNFLMGGGALYPPIFRDKTKADLNRHAIDRIVSFLRDPRALVGVHPEGTRGKGPDPYALLKAQPGIGQMILQAQPIVIPAFVNGLSNDFGADVRKSFAADAKREHPVIAVFGEPFDYSDLSTKKPRLALYKKCSDLLLEKIAELGEVERDIRARCKSGEIGKDDPGWLTTPGLT